MTNKADANIASGHCVNLRTIPREKQRCFRLIPQRSAEITAAPRSTHALRNKLINSGVEIRGKALGTFHEPAMGVRGFGMTREGAFEQAALALTAAVTYPKLVSANEVVDITLRGSDHESLLVDWLNALVDEMATRNMMFSRFEAVILRP